MNELQWTPKWTRLTRSTSSSRRVQYNGFHYAAPWLLVTNDWSSLGWFGPLQLGPGCAWSWPYGASICRWMGITSAPRGFASMWGIILKFALKIASRRHDGEWAWYYALTSQPLELLVSTTKPRLEFEHNGSESNALFIHSSSWLAWPWRQTGLK